jgi:hypothetical protein
MVIDYKGTSFSFNNIRKSKRLRRFRILFLAIVLFFLAILLLDFIDSGRIGTVQSLLLEGKLTEAAEKFESIESSFFHGKTKRELKALINLFKEDFPAAKEILEQMDGSPTAVEYREFFSYFADRALYRQLDTYSGYFEKNRAEEDDSDELKYFRALSKSALMDYRQSEAALKLASDSLRTSKKIELSIIAKQNAQLKEGKVNVIFDVNGAPLAYFDLKAQETVSLAPGIHFDDFNEELKKCLKFFSVTIDRSVQQKVHSLFSGLHGSFILINLNDSGITAAYSKPFDKGNHRNTVFMETYEPGSIIKLLTLLTFLRSPQKDLFPFQCKGNMKLDGKLFYDWIGHNEVETEDDALAVSCNIAFAKMGLHVGYNKLRDVFKRFLFNSGGLRDQFIHFKTGSFSNAVSTNIQLANLSVGLKDVTITTFHAALLSCFISQNGSVYTPHLINNKKNLLNVGYYSHQPKLLESIKDNTTFIKIKDAMSHVVNHPRGTGRRAKVDFVEFALKTGTAGDKRLGLDAVITGFFPVEKPQYAFAFRLERAGKAELKGAFFLKRFLISFFGK